METESGLTKRDDAPFIPLSELMKGDLRDLADNDEIARTTPNPADYPDVFNVEKRAVARTMFMDGRAKASDIASKIDVPERTVMLWASRGGWLKAREEEAAFRKREEKLRIAELRERNRTRIVRENIDTARSLRERANEMMDGAETPGQLKMVAEAINLSSSIELRVAGLSETGKVDGDEEDGEKAGGKSPLVVVYQGNPAGLPPIRKAEVIDAEGE